MARPLPGHSTGVADLGEQVVYREARYLDGRRTWDLPPGAQVTVERGDAHD